MTIVSRPSRNTSLLGGSIELPIAPCAHGPQRRVHPWTGEPGTTGIVAVVGAGKMGLPLCAQFAGHGWDVIAVDINPDVVAAINEGRSHVGEEPGLAELVADAHAAGRLRATADGASAAREADVVVLIVPVMLDAAHQPDYRYMDGAVASIAPGVHAGSLVIFETTLPVGDTRARFAPRLAAASGAALDGDLFVAFSPERLYSGAALKNLAMYPKLVGGIGPQSTDRAARFYASVLDAEVVAMTNAETAEFSKLADTTYRDVNIALATEFARYAQRVDVDITEVIAAANSQPYSHIHQPGIGVGGHCIPVYPHFLLSRAPELSLVAASRQVNDGGVDLAVGAVEEATGSLDRHAGPGARAHLSRRRQGARIQPRGPADRCARSTWRARARLRPAPRRGGDPCPGSRALDMGVRRAGPRDRDPDRGSALACAGLVLVPAPRDRLRRPEQPGRRDTAAGRSHRGRRGSAPGRAGVTDRGPARGPGPAGRS